MNFLIGLMSKIFGRKRRSDRDTVQRFIKFGAIIDGSKFAVSDFSDGGVALVRNPSSSLVNGAAYSAALTLRGETKATVKIKVVRMDGNIIGCEILDQDIYSRFVKNNLKL